jgi:uncharacterized protein involved in tolerance to divalent cations
MASYYICDICGKPYYYYCCYPWSSSDEEANESYTITTKPKNESDLSEIDCLEEDDFITETFTLSDISQWDNPADIHNYVNDNINVSDIDEIDEVFYKYINKDVMFETLEGDFACYGLDDLEDTGISELSQGRLVKFRQAQDIYGIIIRCIGEFTLSLKNFVSEERHVVTLTKQSFPSAESSILYTMLSPYVWIGSGNGSKRFRPVYRHIEGFYIESSTVDNLLFFTRDTKCPARPIETIDEGPIGCGISPYIGFFDKEYTVTSQFQEINDKEMKINNDQVEIKFIRPKDIYGIEVIYNNINNERTLLVRMSRSHKKIVAYSKIKAGTMKMILVGMYAPGFPHHIEGEDCLYRDCSDMTIIPSTDIGEIKKVRIYGEEYDGSCDLLHAGGPNTNPCYDKTMRIKILDGIETINNFVTEQEFFQMYPNIPRYETDYDFYYSNKDDDGTLFGRNSKKIEIVTNGELGDFIHILNEDYNGIITTEHNLNDPHNITTNTLWKAYGSGASSYIKINYESLQDIYSLMLICSTNSSIIGETDLYVKLRIEYYHVKEDGDTELLDTDFIDNKGVSMLSEKYYVLGVRSFFSPGNYKHDFNMPPLVRKCNIIKIVREIEGVEPYEVPTLSLMRICLVSDDYVEKGDCEDDDSDPCSKKLNLEYSDWVDGYSNTNYTDLYKYPVIAGSMYAGTEILKEMVRSLTTGPSMIYGMGQPKEVIPVKAIKAPAVDKYLKLSEKSDSKYEPTDTYSDIRVITGYEQR